MGNQIPFTSKSSRTLHTSDRFPEVESSVGGEEPDETDRAPPKTYDEESSVSWSNSVNVRRIFIVLLTFLVITAIANVTSMYIAITDGTDNVDTVLNIALLMIVVVSLGGVYYAVTSRRLSRRWTRNR